MRVPGNRGGRVRPCPDGAPRAARAPASVPDAAPPAVPARRLRLPAAPARILLLSLSLAGCAGGATPEPPPAPHLPPSLPFADAAVIGCHNCYLQRHAPTIEAALEGAHAIEIDVVDAWAPRSPTGDGPERAPRTWFVAHAPRESRHPSNCGAAPRQTLRECLARVRAWADANRDAGVRIVYLDVKSPWSAPRGGRTPDDLDAVLRETLGDALVSPGELVEKADTSPRRALRRRGWPTRAEMRRHGAVLVVLTDATEKGRDGGGPLLPAYAARLGEAAAWVAPRVARARQVPAWEGGGVRVLPGFDGKASEWVLFLNHRLSLRGGRRADPSAEVGAEAAKAGLVARVWADDERALEAQACAMAAAGFRVIALERFGEMRDVLGRCGAPPSAGERSPARQATMRDGV
jgi:hypothetical protein